MKKRPHVLTEEEKQEYIQSHPESDSGAVQLHLDEIGNHQAAQLEQWRDEALEALLDKKSSAPSAPTKEAAAERLGISVASLDVMVSKHKREAGVDYPWVVRVPGLSWRPDLTKLEEWLASYAGRTFGKRRGRPPKN